MLPVATVVLALLACKSNQDDSSADEAEPIEAAESATVQETAPPGAPKDAVPADLSEFQGCDLPGLVKSLEGTWYAQVGGRPLTFQVNGTAITWHDTEEHQSVLRATSPCSFETDAGNLSGIFVAAGEKLFVGKHLVGRQCGERVVACSSDGRVHVLAAGKCVALMSSSDGVPASAGPGVRRWTSEPSTCSLEKGATESLVVKDAGGRTLRASKLDGVYRDVRWSASKVDSLDTGRRLIELSKELAQADEAGPSRVKVTEGYEKLCDEKQSGYACNNGAWYRCVNLKQCHKSVARARLAVQREPGHPGFLDTLAVVLCRTG
jgi:hypothetical protein